MITCLLVEEDFVSETCKIKTQNYSTMIFKTACFLLLQGKSCWLHWIINSLSISSWAIFGETN